MRRILSLALCVFTSALSLTAQQPIVVTRQGPQPLVQAVTADQVEGVYRSDRDELLIRAFGGDKLKVTLDLDTTTSKRYPKSGLAEGEASIVGNVATFVPEGATKCHIKMKFLTNRVEVTQEGSGVDCGFVFDFSVAGTYRRIKGGHPRLVKIN